MRRDSIWSILRPLELFLCSFLWLECIYRLFCVERFFDRGLLYILLFSMPLALICTILCSLWNKRVNAVVCGVLLGLFSLWYMIQAVYFTIFRTVLVTKSFGMAGDALSNYWRETLAGIGKTLPCLLLLAVPLVVFFLLRRHITLSVRADAPELLMLGGGALALNLLAVLCLNLPSAELLTTRDLYKGMLIPDLAASRFGVMTTLRLDVSQTLFGVDLPDDDVLLPEVPDSSSSADVSADTPPEIVYQPNVLDIDFDSLLANETNKTRKSMHQYFSTREPTLQNEYTGMFKGKNLIMLTGEAFWVGAIHPTYTPTLYKLANEGFIFKNFYNPLWWYSTIDGEYAHCTGLIPSNQSKNSSFKITGMNKNSMYFCMGNMLSMEGYPTTAYHNHTHSYYSRHLSHPNMGYDYYGVGAGLDVKKSWPESDLEMMEKTIPQALEGPKPFHNYYMTVSGHMNYNFVGNAMSMKHKAEVADSGLSEAARAYLACNMELDKALEYVLAQLEAAGELENTVICMSGDHYPYGLDGTGAIDELTAPGTEEDIIEKYRSTLILWCGGMTEPVVVEKPCSSIDVLPTLCNLFGLNYDSRLIIGRDILSTAPGLVPTNKFCFVSELGKYYKNTNTFIPNEGVTVPEGYVEQTFKEVQRMVNYSGHILFQDYYRVIGLKPGVPFQPAPKADPPAEEIPVQ